MFKDKYAVVKAALEIAARRILANNPEVAVVIEAICSLSKSGSLEDIATDLLADQELFQKDPLLMADAKTILTLLGLDVDSIDAPKTKALLGKLCSMV